METLDSQPKTGNVLYLNGDGRRVPHTHYGTEYAANMTNRTVDSCVRHGLNSEFVPIFERHLADLHLVVRAQGQLNDEPTGLEVRATFETPDYETDKHKVWRRLLVVNSADLKLRSAMLDDTITKIIGDSPTGIEATRGPALDWVFYEQAMVALNNACYMQRTYGRYVTDFNGQSPYYRAENTLSAAHIKKVKDSGTTVDQDRQRLEQGFGLMMVHSSLLEHGVLTNATQANWVVEDLRKQHFPDAHSSGTITERLRGIQPDKEVRRRIAEFALIYFDPDEE